MATKPYQNSNKAIKNGSNFALVVDKYEINDAADEDDLNNFIVGTRVDNGEKVKVCFRKKKSKSSSFRRTTISQLAEVRGKLEVEPEGVVLIEAAYPVKEADGVYNAAWVSALSKYPAYEDRRGPVPADSEVTAKYVSIQSPRFTIEKDGSKRLTSLNVDVLDLDSAEELTVDNFKEKLIENTTISDTAGKKDPFAMLRIHSESKSFTLKINPQRVKDGEGDSWAVVDGKDLIDRMTYLDKYLDGMKEGWARIEMIPGDRINFGQGAQGSLKSLENMLNKRSDKFYREYIKPFRKNTFESFEAYSDYLDEKQAEVEKEYAGTDKKMFYNEDHENGAFNMASLAIGKYKSDDKPYIKKLMTVDVLPEKGIAAIDLSTKVGDAIKADFNSAPISKDADQADIDGMEAKVYEADRKYEESDDPIGGKTEEVKRVSPQI